ncbi:unnamed protein product [Rodentolepis nana]|uniref:Capsid protein n=1 Tax=Rodentolepis nana TaxID=102285 RepID=A0A0R3T014_RODNA|nr:unnamed protein product [Rodentolepis nana]
MRQGQKEMNPSTITNTAITSTAGGINSVLGTNGALGVNLQSPWNSVNLKKGDLMLHVHQQIPTEAYIQYPYFQELVTRMVLPLVAFE